ncbi:hypothetical protein OV079_21085 [Nannocystis pusilla]|uniref:Uncharacterized protein n=1 Tax=Nannocystis pusilla TaxID=889268 RepID=A0A9X3ERD9_9BACT|nr:hypothetical protein [Nannocystis pusilla]MCY1008004.1 hypothetical protein [Nannocystis pusilla]
MAATDCASPALEVPTAVRSLEALARENAVEGCVRETFGALVARYQASVAADEPLRRLFAAIAEDELDHAALAWDVATWLNGQLDEAARARAGGRGRRAGAPHGRAGDHGARRRSLAPVRRAEPGDRNRDVRALQGVAVGGVMRSALG